MFRLERTEFGAFEKFVIQNEANTHSFSLVPQIGGTLIDLKMEGKHLLDACKTPDELSENPWGKSALLFPFPNRLRDGRYEWNGTSYQFEINEESTHTALHGFGKLEEMEVLSTAFTTTSGSITLSYFYAGHYAFYPFPFLLEVTYSLSTKNGFEVGFKFTNEAEHTIPVGLGWHPYFCFHNTKVNELHLELPDLQMIDIDERMLPTEQLNDYDYFSKKRLISTAVLDNCFLLSDSNSDRTEVKLSNGDTTLVYWQESGSDAFQYIQLFTPPSRRSIAIEPMTCNIDAFNNGDGLRNLKPEESMIMHCGLYLKD